MDWLRKAEWLTRDRVRGYAWLVALAGLALVGHAYFQAMGPVSYTHLTLPTILRV